MFDKRLEVIFFYLRNKRYAVSRLKTFVPPLDDMQLAEMQVSYGLYFNSLISVIDYIGKDLAQIKIFTDMINIVKNEDNYNYIRELRNSIIHRGLDVSSAGTEIKDLKIIAPFSPAFVENQSGNKRYHAYTNNLLQLVKITEQINSNIYAICNIMQLLEYVPVTKEKYVNKIKNDPYMPDYAKIMSLQNIPDFTEMNINLEKIHNDRIKKYFDTSDIL